jgi:hypothetical protein
LTPGFKAAFTTAAYKKGYDWIEQLTDMVPTADLVETVAGIMRRE